MMILNKIHWRCSKIDRLNLPICPYCQTELGYIEAFTVKNKSSHKCTHCKNITEVSLKSIMFKSLEIIEILSLITAALAIFKGGVYCLLGLIFIVLIFISFYILSPFMMRLNPIDYSTTEKKQKIKDIESDKRSGEDTSEEIFSN